MAILCKLMMQSQSSSQNFQAFQALLANAVHQAFELAYYALALSAAMNRAKKPGFARWMHHHWHDTTTSAMMGFDLLVLLKAPLQLAALSRPNFEPARSFSWLEPLLARERALLERLHELQSIAEASLSINQLLDILEPLETLTNRQVERVERMLYVVETLQLLEMSEGDVNRIDQELMGMG